MNIREELRACAATRRAIPYGLAGYIATNACTQANESFWLLSHQDRATFLLLVAEAL